MMAPPLFIPYEVRFVICNIIGYFSSVCRYVTSGDSYGYIAFSYRNGDRNLSKIVDEVSITIWYPMQLFYLPQHTTEMWETIARRFEELWHIPHCIDALENYD
jgi:hypothetical protein